MHHVAIPSYGLGELLDLAAVPAAHADKWRSFTLVPRSRVGYATEHVFSTSAQSMLGGHAMKVGGLTDSCKDSRLVLVRNAGTLGRRSPLGNALASLSASPDLTHLRLALGPWATETFAGVEGGRLTALCL